jgi:pimeloyl-ACP methyl ester carboxylesterase
MQIHNGDVALNVETAGDASAPPVLLLHGITSSVRSWEWFVPQLSDRYRVLSLDFRGHGKSGRAPGDYQPQRYVDDTIVVLEQVVSAPAILIGHSLGGVTAAALSQQRPELVKAMVLEDPPLGAMEMSDIDLHKNPVMEAFRIMKVSVPGAQAARMQPGALAAMLAAMPTTSGAPMADVVIAEAIHATAASLLELDVSVLDPVLDATAVTAFDSTQPIPVTTLLLTGDPAMPDTIAIPTDVERVLQHSPLVERRSMTGVGHLIHESIKSRDEFVRQVKAFVSKVD